MIRLFAKLFSILFSIIFFLILLVTSVLVVMIMFVPENFGSEHNEALFDFNPVMAVIIGIAIIIIAVWFLGLIATIIHMGNNIEQLVELEKKRQKRNDNQNNERIEPSIMRE